MLHRFVFWGTQIAGAAGGAIYRASMNRERSGDSILLATLPQAVSIALDSSNEVLYWTSGNYMGSVSINGSYFRLITAQLPISFKYLTLVSTNVLLMTYGYNATLVYTNGTIKHNSTEYNGCDNFRYATLISPLQKTKGSN